MSCPANSLNWNSVDIVLLSFNGQAFIGEQIDSILGQDYRQFRLLICDDASTDNTPAIIQQYAADPRVNVVLFDQNVGINAHFERSLQLCSADWIAVSDQDDIWLPTKISTLMQNRENADLVFCNSRLIDAAGVKQNSTLVGSRKFGTKLDLKGLFLGNFVSAHALVFNRRLIDKLIPFDPQIHHDYQLAIVASLLGGISYVPAELVLHRLHDNNNCHDMLHKAAEPKENRQARRTRRQQTAQAIVRVWCLWQRLAREPAMAETMNRPEYKEVTAILTRFINGDKRSANWFSNACYLFCIVWRHRGSYYSNRRVSPRHLWKTCLNISKVCAGLAQC